MSHPTPVTDARCQQLLDLIAGRPDGIERAEMVALWGVSVKCANKPFNVLKRRGVIGLTTPKGGKPRWTTVDKLDDLRKRMAAERAIQSKLSKIERNKRRESRARAETGFRRAHCANAPDMPVVQRRVQDWKPTERPPGPVSVFEWGAS